MRFTRVSLGLLLPVALITAAAVNAAPTSKAAMAAPAPSFEPGAVWLDVDGKPIQAHGGGILFDKGTYYWFGENKDAPNTPSEKALLARIDAVGISCYSSKDLLRWKHEGVVLPALKGDPNHDLHPGGVIERPKVVYNAKTKKYVMWLHIDSADYKKASAGVAVADKATGPYTYLGSVRPDGGESRDMTLFKDDDGKAYLVYSSEWNATTHISLLSDDYLKPVGKMVKAFEGQYREAPAIFKRGALYYIVTSGCTGWYPNRAVYATAPKLTGPWTVQGNPLVGPDAEWTYFGQSTFVLPVQGKKDAFVLMLDRWKSTQPARLALPLAARALRGREDGRRVVGPLGPLGLRQAGRHLTGHGALRAAEDRRRRRRSSSTATRSPSRTSTRPTSRRSCSRASRRRSSRPSTSAGAATPRRAAPSAIARDVAGVKPSLVFVNFGMNDGGYKAFDEATYRNYMDAQKTLADTVKASGARQVFFTTSPIDDVLRGDKGVYNSTLSRMARGVIGLAGERQLPVIDLLHPMVEVQRLAKEKDAKSTMIPDTVHPDAVGHLVMAYLAMRQIDAPRSVGEIVIEGSSVRAADGAVGGQRDRDGGQCRVRPAAAVPAVLRAEGGAQGARAGAPRGRPQPLPPARPGAVRRRAAHPVGRRPHAGRVQGRAAGARRRPRAARQRAVGAGGPHAVGGGAAPLEEALRGLAADGPAEAAGDDARARVLSSRTRAPSARTPTRWAARSGSWRGPAPTACA